MGSGEVGCSYGMRSTCIRCILTSTMSTPPTPLPVCVVYSVELSVCTAGLNLFRVMGFILRSCYDYVIPTCV